MTENNVIGLNNTLPWRIKEELQYFRRVTLHKPIIMGSNTFISLKCKPLTDRYNIVLTKNINKFNTSIHNLNDDIKHNNLIFANNIEDSLMKAKRFYHEYINEKKDYNKQEIFIIGGREVYLQFLPLATQLYLSIIKFNYVGNILFPNIDLSQWKLINTEEHKEFIAKIFLSCKKSDYNL